MHYLSSSSKCFLRPFYKFKTNGVAGSLCLIPFAWLSWEVRFRWEFMPKVRDGYALSCNHSGNLQRGKSERG